MTSGASSGSLVTGDSTAALTVTAMPPPWPIAIW